MVKKAVIISGFPGTGKSWLFNNLKDKNILDSDSSNFSWVSKGVRNNDFPNNYITHIKENMFNADIICISSHDLVREELKTQNINYTIFYPSKECKEIYIQRYINRGNDEAFIEMMKNNFDKFIDQIDKDEFPHKIKMTEDLYISDYINELLSINEDYKEKETNRFEDDTNMFIINNSDNLNDLENEWEEYNSMPKDQRRMSDWKSEELYGSNNKERYDKMKSDLLAKDDFDISDIPLEENVLNEEVEDDKIKFSDIKYSADAVDAAESWSLHSMRVIIHPVESLEKLEDLWIKWNEMIRKNQRESDWKSEELFGINNKIHYDYLKSKFLKKDIDDEEQPDIIDGIVISPISESFIEKISKDIYLEKSNIDIASKCLAISNIKSNKFHENILIKSTIDDAIEYYKDNIADSTDCLYFTDDLPFFDPQEMIDLGVFNGNNNRFSIEPDNINLDDDITVKEWFDNYINLFNGITTENTIIYTKLWIIKLQELFIDFNDIKETKDINKINSRKQSILELGWNPEIDFTIENRIKANTRIKTILNEMYKKTEIIDMTSFVNVQKEEAISIDNDDSILHPVFIILVEGKSFFSNAIKKVTNGVFSHAAIAFDTKLDKMYSYNMNGANGLSIEDIKKYPQDKTLGVFTIFVKGKDLLNIKKNLEYFVDNKDKTRYSFLNVLTLPLNIPLQFDLKMVCSQFVDRLLKLSKIDITDKDSALVNPNDFAIKAYTNVKIYKMFEGKVSDYKYPKINKIINSLKGNAKYIKESLINITNESTYISAICENINDIDMLKILDEKSELLNNVSRNIYNTMIKPYISISILEAKEFPVQFDDDGNLLIKSISKIDFEAEYSKIHKLLINYEKINDIESIKYELSKLWFLNHVLEAKIHDIKFNKEQKNEYYKARAKILNDFNKYLSLVLSKEKSFNFSKYYEDSPFSVAAYKINRSTLKYTGKLLKNIILS